MDLQSCNKIHGVKVTRTAPSISHLFFTDDTLLFGHATLAKAVHLKHAISLYERVSCQLVNYDKSGVVFSPNITENVGASILNVLGMNQCLSHGKYLGLPSVSCRKKTYLFANIVDMIRSKIEGWNGHLLLKGGKEILIKAVLQAISSYTMSCFKFPLGVIDDITSLIRKFWWGSKTGQNKINWIAWRKLIQKKSEGGFGVS